ncbi:MAG TPA: hypothetical protein DEQ98_15040 [Acidobacteria bacterium]|nr:hypothetical protein [Acidobacteriota bacterium]
MPSGPSFYSVSRSYLSSSSSTDWPFRWQAEDRARPAGRARASSPVRTGALLNRIGLAAERTARTNGFEIIRDLCGHGVGQALDESPGDACAFFNPRDTRPMTDVDDQAGAQGRDGGLLHLFRIQPLSRSGLLSQHHAGRRAWALQP